MPDGGSTFTFPNGSTVWSHGLRDHYEAVYERRLVEDVAEGDWAAPPITVKLPGNAGYAAVTEADLRNYAGMALPGLCIMVQREVEISRSRSSLISMAQMLNCRPT